MPVFKAQLQSPSVESLKYPQLVGNPSPPPSPLCSAHILAFPACRGLSVPRISTISLGDSQHAICVTHTGMACRGDKAALSGSRESCDHCSCWRTFATSDDISSTAATFGPVIVSAPVCPGCEVRGHAHRCLHTSASSWFLSL